MGSPKWRSPHPRSVRRYKSNVGSNPAPAIQPFRPLIDGLSRHRFANYLPFYYMNKSQYQIYLKSEHWQRVRGMRLQFSGFRCEHCGCRVTLQVHHLTYARIHREQLADLIVLCDRCHSTIEESIRERSHSRKAKAVHLRRYTHKMLLSAGISMHQHRTRKEINGLV